MLLEPRSIFISDRMPLTDPDFVKKKDFFTLKSLIDLAFKGLIGQPLMISIRMSSFIDEEHYQKCHPRGVIAVEE